MSYLEGPGSAIKKWCNLLLFSSFACFPGAWRYMEAEYFSEEIWSLYMTKANSPEYAMVICNVINVVKVMFQSSHFNHLCSLENIDI